MKTTKRNELVRAPSKIEPDTVAKPKRMPPNAGKGRPLGSPNRFTKTIREGVLEAYEEVGGKAWLVTLATEDPRTFAGLLARMIPAEVNAAITSKLTLEQLILGSLEDHDHE